MNSQKAAETAIFLANLRQGIWLLCIPAWLFGTIERSATVFSHSCITAVDLVQISTASFFLVCWLLLKPQRPERPLLEPQN